MYCSHSGVAVSSFHKRETRSSNLSVYCSIQHVFLLEPGDAANALAGCTVVPHRACQDITGMHSTSSWL